jgi:hypothetical protein
MQKFHILTYARTNSSIVEMPLEETKSIHGGCELVYLKILMIRLRRVQNFYEWLEFKKIVEDNKEFVLKNFNLRWLLSVVDTYADCGAPVEQSSAMLVDSFFTFEKLRSGEQGLICSTKRDPPILCMPVFDGTCLSSINMGEGDDTLINYFHRVFKCLDRTPMLRDIFIVFMENAWKFDSHFSALSPYYVYIKSGYNDKVKDSSCQ